METLKEWMELTTQSFSEMASEIASFLPNIAFAIVILFQGWLITKIIVYVLSKVLKATKVDQLVSKVNDMQMFGSTPINIKLSDVILKFAKWMLFFFFLILAANILKWEGVSTGISNMLSYIPRILSALVLLVVGIYLANMVKKAILSVFTSFEFSGGKLISSFVFYLITVFVGITALNQAGIDTTLITTNITLVIGAFLLAIAIGIGLGSKDVITDILKTFYTRKNYLVGDKIEINSLKGTIVAIDNACMTLKTKDGKIIIPIKEVVESRVKVKS